MPAGKVGDRCQGQVGVSQTAGPWGMQTKMQLQVNELGEATWADTALERPGPRVQAQVGLQVAGAAEALVTHLMGMGTGISSACLGHPGSLLPTPHLENNPHHHHHLPVMQAWKLFPMIPPWDHSIWHIGDRQTGLVSWFFYSLYDLVQETSPF